MEERALRELRIKLLNHKKGVQQGLRESVPAVGRLESLTGLTELQLSEFEAKEGNPMTASYTAVASPELYTGIRQRLIDEGIASDDGSTRKSTVSSGKPEEHEKVQMSFYGSSVQIFLHVYKNSPRRLYDKR